MNLSDKKNHISYYFLSGEYLLLIDSNNEVFFNNTRIEDRDIIGASILHDQFLKVDTNDKQVVLDFKLNKIFETTNSTLFFDNHNLVSLDTTINENGSINCNWHLFNIEKQHKSEKLFSSQYGLPILLKS